MKFMSIDIETYSDIDINKAGVYRYVDTDAFKILLLRTQLTVVPYSLSTSPEVTAYLRRL